VIDTRLIALLVLAWAADSEIRTFKNHHHVDYLEEGRKMSGKWPRDFESWAQLKT
jgi:hypothetical protein